MHPGFVAVDQAWEQNLIETVHEMMLKGRPEAVAFEIRIHSREWAAHGASPMLPAA
jgi:hypothetical protein